jgi:hypothetical protein
MFSKQNTAWQAVPRKTDPIHCVSRPTAIEPPELRKRQMVMQRVALVAALVLIQISCANQQSAPSAKATSPPPAPPWRSLFNGRDLESWVPVGSAQWRVEEGVIVGGQDGDPKRSGLLTSKDSFKDFELVLDFMIDEHGKYNSGVYLRNDPGKGGRSGYQVNIGRGAAGEFCGGVYTTEWLAKGDEKDEIRKPLKWNTLRIVAQGAHLVVDLNGVNIVDYTDPKPNPKFLRSGVLGLQTYGAEGYAGWVKFRNIKIREL